MPDRIIRESICTSDTLNLLSDFEERFWTHLMVVCDDFGRFDARPAVLKSRLFPLRESLTFKNVTDCLAKLASVGLIELYEVDGRPFLHVVTWERYQRIRAKKSKFPGPGDAYHTVVCRDTTLDAEKPTSDSNAQTLDVNCRQMTTNVPECGGGGGGESESESESGGGTRAREAAAPAGFVLPPMSRAVEAFCNKINPTPSQRSLAELESFEAQMGPECCLRAIDEALDARKANWNYIRAILRSKLDQGVRCIADWDNLERKREEKTREDAKNDDRFYR